MRRLILYIFLGLIFFTIPIQSFAKIGVGVGTGKIQVDDDLKPGIIYQLPSLTVFNTGDVDSEYTVNVAYHEKQPELRPEKSWLQFSPAEFELKPGESQEVQIKLNLPVRTEPGDYFAYLEGSPITKSANGATTVGIAAAAKLYFTIVPGNILEGIYFKLLSMWDIYAPWPQVILGIIVVMGIILLGKKYLNIQINVKGDKRKSPKKLEAQEKLANEEIDKK